MSLIENIISKLKSHDPEGAIHVVDRSPLRNTARGARLERVIFLNDVSQKDALDAVCMTTGEVDIVTNVSPHD